MRRGRFVSVQLPFYIHLSRHALASWAFALIIPIHRARSMTLSLLRHNVMQISSVWQEAATEQGTYLNGTVCRRHSLCSNSTDLVANAFSVLLNSMAAMKHVTFVVLFLCMITIATSRKLAEGTSISRASRLRRP